MKKLLLLGAFAVFSAVNAQAGFKLGAHIGLPTGDSSSAYSFTAGVDASYLWPVAQDLNIGLATGYNAYFGKSIDVDFLGYSTTYDVPTLSLVPVAASAQYLFTPQFSLGVDLGYGFLFQDGENDGGFYYQPKAAYHFGPSQVFLSYAGVSKDGATLSSVNLGYAYSFGK